MTSLNFKTLSFKKEGDELIVTLLRLFYTKIPLPELEKIGKFEIKDAHTIVFKNIEESRAEKKFSFLLAKYFEDLRNRLTNNSTTYIHKNSGIPLIGNVSFGIVYRNSSIIEIKPITSCNLNCVYCSISEGLESKKHDFVVEKDYLVEELKKLIDFVGEKVEIHIGVQGEPFLYGDLEELIADIQKMKEVTRISVDTNATLLNKETIDRLSKNDKLQLNFSLDALDEKKAKEIAGTERYNLNQVKEVISYAAEKLNQTLIAPVIMQGYNDDQVENIIQFVKSLKDQPRLGFQNFLTYKTGKNPAKVRPWKDFFKTLEQLEKKHDIKLKLSKEDFSIRKTKELPKPFAEDGLITARIKCPDRFPNTSIATAKDRTISIPNCPFKKDKIVELKIFRDKHNIFNGRLV